MKKSSVSVLFIVWLIAILAVPLFGQSMSGENSSSPLLVPLAQSKPPQIEIPIGQTWYWIEGNAQDILTPNGKVPRANIDPAKTVVVKKFYQLSLPPNGSAGGRYILRLVFYNNGKCIGTPLLPRSEDITCVPGQKLLIKSPNVKFLDTSGLPKLVVNE